MKTLTLLSLLILSSIGFSQQTATVTGKVDNPTGDKVYIRHWVKGERRWTPEYLDSCVLKDGNFELKVEIDSLTEMQLYDGNEMAFLFMKPGENLNLTFNTMYFDETTQFSGDGAARHEMWKQLYLIGEQVQMLTGMAIKDYNNNDNKDTTTLFKKIYSLDSAHLAMINYQKSKFPEMEVYLDNKIKGVEFGQNRIKMNIRKEIQMDILQEEVEGKAFLDFAGINLDGKDSKLSDYYGNIIVLDFWATWCGPCKAQFPDMHKLEKEYEGKVTFLSVAVSCKEKDWKKMAKAEGFKYNIYLNKEQFQELSEAYMIATIPRYMILDAQGNLLNFNAARPSGDLSAQLDELLK